ncbi:hypothetical protein ACHAXS_000718 [Conticribra weissflogii]
MAKSDIFLISALSTNASNVNNICCPLSMILCNGFRDTSSSPNLISWCNIIPLNLIKNPRSSVLSSHLLANTNTNTSTYPWASSVPLNGATNYETSLS